jgi:hypothetical protein
MDCRDCGRTLRHIVQLNKIVVYDHSCQACGYMLCRTCDDRTQLLRWKEIGEEEYYLCKQCYDLERDADILYLLQKKKVQTDSR